VRETSTQKEPCRLIDPYGGRLADVLLHPKNTNAAGRRARGFPSTPLSEHSRRDLELLANVKVAPIPVTLPGTRARVPISPKATLSMGIKYFWNLSVEDFL
jgi:hypothetical protein